MTGIVTNNCLHADNISAMAEVKQSALQTHGITSRWLTKVLPWVTVDAGIYQVNRSLDVRLPGGIYPRDLSAFNLATTKCISDQRYELSRIRSTLKLEVKSTDIYNKPHDVTAEQIRLSIEHLRERQEHCMVNDSKFGLLNVAHERQCLDNSQGNFIGDMLDDLISLRRSTNFLFAHPYTLATFGNQCNERGLITQTVALGDGSVLSWRGIPLLSCSKIPISKDNTSSIIALRVGENNEGVIGLMPTLLPEQIEPGINIRFMGVSTDNSVVIDDCDCDDHALDVVSYLLTNYFSVAVLLPSALGILKNVKVVLPRHTHSDCE